MVQLFVCVGIKYTPKCLKEHVCFGTQYNRIMVRNASIENAYAIKSAKNIYKYNLIFYEKPLNWCTIWQQSFEMNFDIKNWSIYSQLIAINPRLQIVNLLLVIDEDFEIWKYIVGTFTTIALQLFIDINLLKIWFYNLYALDKILHCVHDLKRWMCSELNSINLKADSLITIIITIHFHLIMKQYQT